MDTWEQRRDRELRVTRVCIDLGYEPWSEMNRIHAELWLDAEDAETSQKTREEVER